MGKTFTDLSQLTKAILKESTPSCVEPAPVAQPEPAASDEEREAEEVLAYFSCSPQNSPRNQRVASGAKQLKDRTAELKAAQETKDAAPAALAAEKAYPLTAKQSPETATRGDADKRIAELERLLAAEREAHAATAQERDRLRGECGRLQGELRKKGDSAAEPALAEAASVAKVEQPPKPAQGILTAPATVAEVFPGEVREQVVATLFDGLGAAERSGRERRAEILRYVLAANESAGELERRRVELRQLLKDAGCFNDPKPLERIGLHLISGRNHWKLQYANVRVVMAKTPSDYRANLNTSSEIANRCF